MNKPQNRNANARYVTMDIAVTRYNMCANKVRELAKEAGAMIKYGRLTRFDVEKMDSFLETECTE